MRQRIEDLGRISVLIDSVLDLDVWNIHQGRNKDFISIFRNLDEDKQSELLSDLIYGIAGLKERLEEISSIAEGTDRLNETDQ